MAVRNRILIGLAAAGLFAAPTAYAQTDPLTALDAMVDASAPDSGMALARQQIAAGELNGALGTLERVLMNDPRDDAALLLHVSLLCRVDDRPGARVELAEMRGIVRTQPGWSEVDAACDLGYRP